tara:strand:+ start:1731 stop:3620 length:1890 start_codon:yes stop_codon:yes gene_type:complete
MGGAVSVIEDIGNGINKHVISPAEKKLVDAANAAKKLAKDARNKFNNLDGVLNGAVSAFNAAGSALNSARNSFNNFDSVLNVAASAFNAAKSAVDVSNKWIAGAGKSAVNATKDLGNATGEWTKKAAKTTAKFAEKNGAIALKGTADLAVTVGEGTVKLAKDGYNAAADSAVGQWVEKAANEVADFSTDVANDTAELAKDIGDFTEKHANDFRDFTAEQVEMALTMAGVDFGEKTGTGEMGDGSLDEATCAQLSSFDWVGGVCIEKVYVDRIIDQSVCGTLSAFEWTNDQCVLKDGKVDYTTQCMTNGGDISMEMLLPVEPVVSSTVETYVTPPMIGKVKLSVDDQKVIEERKKRLAILELFKATSDVRKRIEGGKKKLKAAEREYSDKVREQQAALRVKNAARLHLDLKERELAAEKVKQSDALKLVNKKVKEAQAALVERNAAKREKDRLVTIKNAAITNKNNAIADGNNKQNDYNNKSNAKNTAQTNRNNALNDVNQKDAMVVTEMKAGMVGYDKWVADTKADGERRMAEARARSAARSRSGQSSSDPRLKDAIHKIGTYNGLNVYEWVWNDIATTIYGLRGREIGFLTTELDPEYIDKDRHGYGYIKNDTMISDALKEVRATMTK